MSSNRWLSSLVLPAFSQPYTKVSSWLVLSRFYIILFKAIFWWYLLPAVFFVLSLSWYIKGRIVINNNCFLPSCDSCAIKIIFGCFHFASPDTSASYLLSFENFSVHLIVPVLAIIDFFIFDYKIEFGKLKQLIALAMPLYYLIFVLTLSAFSVDFNGEIVPYFFLNYEKNGWLWEKNEMGVIFWIIILSLCMVMLAYLFSFAIKSREKQRENKIINN